MSGYDVQSSVVAWASFVVTTIGLGGLITQASAIGDQMDPFFHTRQAEYLGVWFERQRKFPWYRIAKPAPRGPLVIANVATGFCNKQTIYIMRIPPAPPGTAGWSILLAMFHSSKPQGPIPPNVFADGDGNLAEKAVTAEARMMTMTMTLGDGRRVADDGWPHLEQQPLMRYKNDACVTITRATLVIMLVMTNARPVFEYKAATGYRAGFGSYAGQWYITWVIGEAAVIKFARHDSLGSTEVLPRFFSQRVDRCGEMACGIVSSPSTGLHVAFCGRKYAGLYKLELGKNGFQGAHSGRHLYNMMGGKAYKFDFLFARTLRSEQSPAASTTLILPSREGGRPGHGDEVKMIVPPAEEQVIQHALDCLSWTSLSWSVHRGLRDILLAYSKPVMDLYRTKMSHLLYDACTSHRHALQALGWDADFILNNMGDMAVSALIAGVGNSGDSVRVVTDIVSVLVDDWPIERYDNVHFWRREARERPQPGRDMDYDTIVALTKVFVLEWSQEFDYQMYHHLPIHLLMG